MPTAGQGHDRIHRSNRVELWNGNPEQRCKDFFMGRDPANLMRPHESYSAIGVCSPCRLPPQSMPETLSPRL